MPTSALEECTAVRSSAPRHCPGSRRTREAPASEPSKIARTAARLTRTADGELVSPFERL